MTSRAKVYFASVRRPNHTSLVAATGELFSAANFNAVIAKDDLVALKLNIGEKDNTSYLRPIYARKIVEKVKECGGNPFLTDANTLYKGSRSNAVDHTRTAIENGFDYANIGAPFIVADGLNGRDIVNIKIDQKRFQEVKVGAAAVHADAIISLAHFKGHEITGFGGTLKNIGMGFGCRAGKQLMHADIKPSVNPKKCTACAKCADNCPAECILIEETALIDQSKCIGCGECIVSCPTGAIAINWMGSTISVMEKIVEYVYGITKDKQGKMAYFNFLLTITPECDCYNFADAPFVPDIGILASVDPVALDQASADLVNQSEGVQGSVLGEKYKAKDKFNVVHPQIEWRHQLDYAVNLGLGTREYELITI